MPALQGKYGASESTYVLSEDEEKEMPIRELWGQIPGSSYWENKDEEHQKEYQGKIKRL